MMERSELLSLLDAVVDGICAEFVERGLTEQDVIDAVLARLRRLTSAQAAALPAPAPEGTRQGGDDAGAR